jgi:phytanoyl-CoA hydroxylase
MESVLNHSPQTAPREEILCFPRSAGPEKYPTPEQAEAFKEWFDREGYIVVRKAVRPGLCASALQAFQAEVLPDRMGFFERHASGKYERHVVTSTGFMKYPIMNLQDIATKKYPHFKKRGLDLLTQATIQRAVSILFGEPGRVVHTMYFDGNQTTWAHRDGHYIDSQQAGKMIGVWVAAEDIHPEAGRFFILPRSHRVPVPGEQDDPNSQDYKAKMASFVRDGPLDCVAPLLKQGDMLLWTSMTIHGSLPTADKRFSRRSFTAHYVPLSHQFQWNVRARSSQRRISVNGAEVILHGDDGSWFKRLRNAVRSDWPSVYGWLRALAMQNPRLH